MDCRCTISYDDAGFNPLGAIIEFCPLHEAASELLDAAQFALKVFENADISGNWWVPSREKIEAAIAKAAP